MKVFKRFFYKWVSKRFLNGCSNFNSLQVRRNNRTKEQARKLFDHIGVPYARGVTFYWPWVAFRFVKKYGFPVVIKPNLGGYSRGSYFPLTNKWQLLKASLLVKIWWPKSVIEQYLEGHNYRIVITKDGVDILSERFSPFVLGDGTSTLKQLMHAENAVRIEKKLLPVIHLLQLNRTTRTFIKKQGYKPQDIIPKGKKVLFFYRVALQPGGVLENMSTSLMHRDNKKLCRDILKATGANILGIDAIFQEGIEKSYKKQNTIFLELNSRPFLKMHDYPRWGKASDIKRLESKLKALKPSDTDLF